MANVAEPDHIHKDVVCPFCGLGCDDLELRIGPQRLEPNVQCERGRKCYELQAKASAPTARVNGRVVCVENAIETAARILAESPRTLITGMHVDVSAARAAVQFARSHNAVLDHAANARGFAAQRVFQRSGAITATFSEVRNRADCFLLVGTDAVSVYPRFVERLAAPPHALFTQTAQRSVLYVGPADRALAGKLAPLAVRSTLEANASSMASVLASLATAVRTGSLPRGDEHLGTLMDALLNARYGVVVWAASQFPDPYCEFILEALLDSLRALNQKTRFVGLPLASDATLTTANQVCTWLTGFALPVAFRGGTAVYDPARYSTTKWLADDCADTVVHVASWAGHPRGGCGTAKEIVIAPMLDSSHAEPTVFIPIATPGIAARGQVFRGDGVVALPLEPFREAPVPSMESVLRRLQASTRAAAHA